MKTIPLGLPITAVVLAAAALAFPSAGAVPAQQAYVKASNTGSNDWFGWSVAIHGDTMVIGAPQEDSSATGVNGNQSDDSAASSGAAYVFVREGMNWIQQAYLKASNAEAFDRFGHSVAIFGDTVVVGAPEEDSGITGVVHLPITSGANGAPNSGAAYIFARTGTNWTQRAYFKASNTGPGDNFGYTVAISGDTVIVGAKGEDSDASGVNGNMSNNSLPEAGAAYIFLRDGTTWQQQTYLKASNPGDLDVFGISVAVSGDTAVVGAAGEGSNATGVNGDQANNSAFQSGAAYVFARTGTNWSQQAYLKASNTEADDLFGNSVAVSGNTVVVGAFVEDSAATGVNGDQSDNSADGAGAAYVFARSGASWSQQAYLKAPNTGLDYFGVSVGVSGNTIAVGAELEGSSADFSGATCVFVRHGHIWSQQAFLKAANPGTSDSFGLAVAVSGDTVVVGAPNEDSASTGINGDQTNNNATDSGTTYVFTDAGIGPTLALTVDGNGGRFIRFAGHPGFTYQLQRSAAVNLPGPWPIVLTTNAPASGLVEFHDATPSPGQVFYRVAQQ